MRRGSAADIEAIELTGGQLGRILGISERRVRELRDQGTISDLSTGGYSLEAVTEYCAHMRPASGRAAAGGSEGAGDLDAARIRLLTAQADAREMLNEQMRGEAVLAEDMESVVGSVLDGVRSKVLAVPTKAAPHLVGMTNLAEVRDKLTELIHAACEDIAATDAVCASVTDRARRRAGRGASGEPADEAAPAATPADGKRVG